MKKSEGITLREDRKDALQILRKENSGLCDKQERIETIIDNMELHSSE